jgi:hypothetical protein
MGAHIDNPRAVLRQLVCLNRRNGSGVGQAGGLAAFGGTRKNFFSISNSGVHVIPLPSSLAGLLSPLKQESSGQLRRLV